IVGPVAVGDRPADRLALGRELGAPGLDVAALPELLGHVTADRIAHRNLLSSGGSPGPGPVARSRAPLGLVPANGTGQPPPAREGVRRGSFIAANSPGCPRRPP